MLHNQSCIELVIATGAQVAAEVCRHHDRATFVTTNVPAQAALEMRSVR